MTPKISVITAAYNEENYIAETIDSVLGQTFTDFEYIIVDDGSTDNTLGIIQGYTDPRIRVITRENRGVCASRNEAVEMCQGKYIANIDGNDICMPSRLQQQYDFMEQNPDCVLLGMTIQGFNESYSNLGLMYGISTRRPIDQHALMYCRHRPFAWNTAFMVRVDVLENLGDFQRPYTCEDADMNFRISQFGRVCNMPDIGVLCRSMDTGLSKSLFDTYDADVTMSRISLYHTLHTGKPCAFYNTKHDVWDVLSQYSKSHPVWYFYMRGLSDTYGFLSPMDKVYINIVYRVKRAVYHMTHRPLYVR